MKKIIAVLPFIILLFACNDEMVSPEVDFSGECDMSLIGQAVQFEPYAEMFSTRNASVNKHDGSFNTGDMMYIYRQYYNVQQSKWEYHTPPGTLYKFTDLTNGSTGLFDKESWKPYVGQHFVFQSGDTEPYDKLLNDADSIIWENGNTVRFRAWVLSRLGNNLDYSSSSKVMAGNMIKVTSINYPDYMVCDWVSVAGPTMKIPMAMRHLGCRFQFTPKNYNVFRKIEISTDPADYRRDDNSDTPAHDEADKVIRDENGNIISAETAAANVLAAWNKMCFPAGVDIEDMTLEIENKDNRSTKYSVGTQTPEFIASNVHRPEFSGSGDSRYSLITTPYDMSNSSTSGEPIFLPPYTRLRIWLKDVNNGDYENLDPNKPGSTSENRYHIFALNDVLKSGTSEKAFPNGITLKAGDSYLFDVGYMYNALTIYASDNFSWAEQDAMDLISSDDTTVQPDPTEFAWWKKAIEKACDEARNSQGYNPVFEINTTAEWIEFAKLVNGDFTYWADGINHNQPPLQKKVTKKIVNGTEVSTVRWFREVNENADGSKDTIFLSRAMLESFGYIFYQKYTQADGTIVTSIEEDYLREPYTFRNASLGRQWTVKLGADIDFGDYPIVPVGNNIGTFAGILNGQGHTLKNVYLPADTPYLFGSVSGISTQNAVISHLNIESLHPTSIAGDVEYTRILGCSLYAPSTTGALAHQAKGNCYFVGCIHVGDAANPMVENITTSSDKSLNLNMLGCMQASHGLTSAALATVTNSNESSFNFGFVHDKMDVDEVKALGTVACNYFDKELSPGIYAYRLDSKEVKGVMTTPNEDGTYKTEEGAIHRKHYIRGAKTHVLCAKNDYLIDAKTQWNSLTDIRKEEYYGVAPWRAMNYAIYKYNDMWSGGQEAYKCKAHYEVDSKGYAHRYPELKSDVPAASQYKDVTGEFN